MTCTCDLVVHPLPLDIQPGLNRLPRQVAGFPQLREAMLHDIGSAEHAAALGAWTGTGPNDFGVMLVEMFAYVADVLAFYDEVHAHECYLRTARREASVRDLVARLGYRPRPAVAATVELALLADGRKPVTVPAGTAFRSGPFEAEAPQVFEVGADALIHPLRGSWGVQAPRPVRVDDAGGPGAVTAALKLSPSRSAKWAEGDLMLVQPDPATSSTWKPAVVTSAEPVTDEPGERWLELELDRSVNLGAGRALAGVRLLKPSHAVGLWQRTSTTVLNDVNPAVLTLDAVYRDIRPGEVVLVQCTRDEPGNSIPGVRWFKVTKVEEITFDVTVATTPAAVARLSTTRITLDADIDTSSRGSSYDWDNDDAPWLFVHYGLRDAGRLGAPQQPLLSPTDTLSLRAAPTPVGDTAATRFVLQDIDGVAVAGDGAVDFGARQLQPTSYDHDRPTLTLPVTAFGNLVTATRGETVSREVLGSGDATAANQAFTLKKGPLTHVASAGSDTGYSSTLAVWVDGRAWSEAESFYGVGPEDRVYVVTLDAEGLATVTFGDGVRGARLPTGVDNVVASYRRGAGAAAPPAGSITQIAKGTPGLKAVKQPLVAYGGADAEGPDEARVGAPRQALTLGRAVSILDMEAFAAACAGVRAVSARWAWDGVEQRPVVKVWVVGEGDVASSVRARLLGVSDPSTPITVASATALPVTLELAVTAAEGWDGEQVDAAVAEALWGEAGALKVEALGVGRPLYFSALYAAIHAVAGVSSVSLAWTRGGGLVTGYGDSPGEGAWFDLSGGITLNGEDIADA